MKYDCHWAYLNESHAFWDFVVKNIYRESYENLTNSLFTGSLSLSLSVSLSVCLCLCLSLSLSLSLCLTHTWTFISGTIIIIVPLFHEGNWKIFMKNH